jgi:hypothetical protein
MKRVQIEDIDLGDIVIIDGKKWEVTATDGQNFVAKSGNDYDAFNPKHTKVYKD